MTLLIVFEAKLVPLFLIMQQLDLQNTYISIILPWITDAFFIFLFRTMTVALVAKLAGCRRQCTSSLKAAHNTYY